MVYRFSWLRPGGWTRLGVAGGLAVVFGTPMLWALGVFGRGPESISLAVVFLMSGLWLFIALGYGVGWALRGFMVKVKAEGEDDEGGDPHPPARSAGGAAAHRPGH